MRRMWVALSLPCLLLSPLVAQEQGAEPVDFVKQIKPILEQRCARCHGPDESKGDFQMHTKEAFFRGGLGGSPVEPGDAEASLLYELITLGPDEEGRMPPEGDPLSEEEIRLIRDWINQGAKWPDGVTLSVGPERKKDPIEEMLSGPGLEVTEAERKAIEKYQRMGALVLPIAQNTNWVRIDFSLGAPHVTDSDLADLPAIQNLVELDLGGTKITSQALQYVGQCRNLVRLHLERTAVDDEGLKHLADLPYLIYLNLYGTKVTDAGLQHLKGLKNLRRLYVWQTGVTPAGVDALKQALPQVEIVTGWELQVAEAKKQEQQEAKPAEPKQEAKKEEKAQQKQPAKTEPAAKADQQAQADKKPTAEEAQPERQPNQDKSEKKAESPQEQKKPESETKPNS